MRRYYTYDDDEYLAHSKGPWRVHKYIKKLGEGANARYVYARDTLARKSGPLRRMGKYYAGEARAAGMNMKRKARFAYDRAKRAAYVTTQTAKNRINIRTAPYRRAVRDAAANAYGSARRKAKLWAGEARAAGINARRRVRAAGEAATRKAKLWAGEARAAGINARRKVRRVANNYNSFTNTARNSGRGYLAGVRDFVNYSTTRRRKRSRSNSKRKGGQSR